LDWPEPLPYTRCGYAGGIGPDNVQAVMRKLVVMAPSHTEFWIDTESGVRTGDTFDLDKAVQVVNLVNPFMEA
jgi:phosphoribosylanthranilate isomerase